MSQALLRSTRLPFYRKVQKLFPGNIVAYWPLNEYSGTVVVDKGSNHLNGAYASGMALANATDPFRNPAPLIDATHQVNLYSATLNSLFSGTEGTLIINTKVLNSGVLTDSAIRSGILLGYDLASNFAVIEKSNYRYKFIYYAGGVGKELWFDTPYTGWMQLAMTWSITNDQQICYVNGVQGSNPNTGIGTWSGDLNAIRCAIGAFNGTTGAATNWAGWTSGGMLLNKALSASEIESLYGLFNPVRLTVIGDSISVYTLNGALRWSHWTAGQYNNGVVRISQRAISGQYIMSGMDGQVTAAANDHADIIICQLGTGDDNAGNMTTLQAEVEENLAEIGASNGAAEIYYMNVLPRWTDVGGGTPVDKSNIRTAIAAACAAQGVTCWDTFTTPWIDAADTSDGLHPTSAGHEKIATQVLARL